MKHLIRYPIAKWLSSLIVLSTLSVGVAQAQTAPVVCPGYKKSPTKIPGQRVGKKVQAAFEAYNNDQVDEAITILREIEASDPFDQAYVSRFVGNLLAAKEGQGKVALSYLLDSVKDNHLNDSEHAITLRLVGDLNMQEKQYSDAIIWYDRWMDFTCKQNADIYTRQGFGEGQPFL